MSNMSSALTARETNRLHRWAMWRMTVNEGIISCIRDSATLRVMYPDSSASDSSSLTTSEVPELHEFPFITPEQMSLARKLNLREKYGSNHGLSDDAYFIFGLPRINVGKDIPEVTSTGTRSVYESFSELGDAVNGGSRGQGADNGGGVSVTYSELGPTPDSQSLASHANDVEVQRINGYREDGWKSPPPSVPGLNLYSIQEELNNNNTGEVTHHYPSNHNPESERTHRYSSHRYSEADTTTGSCSFRRYQETKSADRYTSGRYRLEDEPTSRYMSNRYQVEEEETPNGLSSRYAEVETVDRYPSSRYRERDRSGHFSTNRFQVEAIPTYSVRQAIDRYESVNRYASAPEPVYTRRKISSTSSSDRFNRNSRSAPQSPSAQVFVYPPFSPSRQNSGSAPQSPSAQDFVYPPFSPSRQNSGSPSRRSYSPLPSSPRQNYSLSPAFPTSPTYSRQQSYAPSTSARKSSFPSGSGGGGGGGGQGVGSPGYGNRMRPTRLLSDGECEKLKRQAYYDWTTPTNEPQRIDFPSVPRYMR